MRDSRLLGTLGTWDWLVDVCSRDVPVDTLRDWLQAFEVRWAARKAHETSALERELWHRIPRHPIVAQALASSLPTTIEDPDLRERIAGALHERGYRDSLAFWRREALDAGPEVPARFDRFLAEVGSADERTPLSMLDLIALVDGAHIGFASQRFMGSGVARDLEVDSVGALALSYFSGSPMTCVMIEKATGAERLLSPEERWGSDLFNGFAVARAPALPSQPQRLARQAAQ